MVEKTTNILYKLNDGTAQIDCTQWIESDEDSGATESRTQFQEGAYVRIIGHLRVFNDARTLSAFHVNLVTDHNEVTHHFLEVLFVHLQNTRGPFNPAHKAGAASAMAAGNPTRRRRALLLKKGSATMAVTRAVINSFHLSSCPVDPN